jgi:hypothetical protein
MYGRESPQDECISPDVAFSLNFIVKHVSLNGSSAVFDAQAEPFCSSLMSCVLLEHQVDRLLAQLKEPLVQKVSIPTAKMSNSFANTF